MGRKQIWLQIVVALFLLGSMADQLAMARRLGGGSSFGRTAPSYSKRIAPAPSGASSSTSNTATAPKPAQSSPAPAAAPQQPRSRFLGPLAGLAAGLGLAALFNHFGFGAGLSSMLGTLLLVLASVWLFSKLVRRVLGGALQSPTMQTGGGQRTNYDAAPLQPNQNQNQFGNAFNAPTFEPAPAPAEQAAGMVKVLPAGFDESAFIAQVKQFYVNMQAVFDRADLSELHRYCTDDVLQALEQDIKAQRPAGGQQTDVVTLNAELIGFELDVDEEIATVHFSGHVREAAGEPAEQFEELWTLVRPVAPAAGAGWLLAGVHSL